MVAQKGKKTVQVFPTQRSGPVDEEKKESRVEKNCILLAIAIAADIVTTATATVAIAAITAAAHFFFGMFLFVCLLREFYMYNTHVCFDHIYALFCIGMEYRLAINETRNLSSETNKTTDER